MHLGPTGWVNHSSGETSLPQEASGRERERESVCVCVCVCQPTILLISGSVVKVKVGVKVNFVLGLCKHVVVMIMVSHDKSPGINESRCNVSKNSHSNLIIIITTTTTTIIKITIIITADFCVSPHLSDEYWIPSNNNNYIIIIEPTGNEGATVRNCLSARMSTRTTMRNGRHRTSVAHDAGSKLWQLSVHVRVNPPGASRSCVCGTDPESDAPATVPGYRRRLEPRRAGWLWCSTER